MINMIFYDPEKEKQYYISGDLKTGEWSASYEPNYFEDYDDEQLLCCTRLIEFDDKTPMDFFKEQISKYGYYFMGFVE